MKSGVLVTAVVLATGGAAAAQSAVPQATTAAPQVSSASPQVQSAATQPQTSRESRHDAMRVMEGVLTASVKSGAAQLSRRIQAIAPSLLVLSGDARARGFLIEGYGVFFDVEVPAINPAIMWSMQTLNHDRTVDTSLAQLRQSVTGITDPATRQQAVEALNAIAQQVAPTPGAQQPNIVTAASTDPTPPPPANIADANFGEEYTEAVKRALVDAMLDYSASMKLGPDEWLSVAASDSSGPDMPGQLYDVPTTILRVKGSDLTAYQTGKITRDEAVKRVEIREF